MARIRGTNTRPEMELRRRLWSQGLRYRLHVRSVPGTPDIVFRAARLAVFVDGCFWHACPRHTIWPKTRSRYWRKKLSANRARDRAVDMQLAALGWQVVRVWEHQIDECPSGVVGSIMNALGRGATQS